MSQHSEIFQSYWGLKMKDVTLVSPDAEGMWHHPADPGPPMEWRDYDDAENWPPRQTRDLYGTTYDVVVICTQPPDELVASISSKQYIAYANPEVHAIVTDNTVFLGVPVAPTTPEMWERAIGLVVCDMARRFQR